MKNHDEHYVAARQREADAWAVDVNMPDPEPLDAEAPAPRLQKLIDDLGATPSAQAIRAWQARMMGSSIIDVAAGLHLSVSEALRLLNEVHTAVREDLKENLDLNRSIDLARVDALISTHLPRAKEGKIKSGHLVLKCLQHRSKLVGLEPMPSPGRSATQSVQIWLQAQLPGINKLVDSLPTELPPSAP